MSLNANHILCELTFTTTTVLQPLYKSTCVNFVGAKFYCPHALAVGNQCIHFIIHFISGSKAHKNAASKKTEID